METGFRPAEFNAKSGATAVGAREFLIAYNINLNTTDRRYANEIAYEIRERGRWKRAGNIEPFYYKGDVVYFEEGNYRTAIRTSWPDLSKNWRSSTRNIRRDLYKRYAAIGLDPENLAGARSTRTACSPTSRASAGWWMTTSARRSR